MDNDEGEKAMYLRGISGEKLILIAALMTMSFSGALGCASTPDMRRNDEVGPAQIVGSPPPEGSEDYEFAPPPSHPGDYGNVAAFGGSGQGGADASGDFIARAELDRLLSQGPSVVLTHVDTEPRREEGEFVGFRIVDASDAALGFMSPKLRVGDVVTHVNLVRMERPDQYVEAWETLGEAEEVRVDFLRDGEAQQAIWQIR